MPNLTLGIMDISADSYLSKQYYDEWTNETMTGEQHQKCYELKNRIQDGTYTLEAFSTCLNSQSKFFYTIGFLLLSVVFYLTEFLVLGEEYEPTGLRKKISVRDLSKIF